MKFEPVIGLEVHAQLSTESKIFCGCSTRFGAEPNTQTCPVCLGMPGVLPVTNKKVIEYAVRMAFAVHCKMNTHSILARKNYFYPDLPKGYQISQYEEPLAEKGWVKIGEEEKETRKIRILRIHIEEDAGKSVHDEAYVESDESMMDFNRCGTPLIEIVSQPDLRTPKEAFLYLTQLRQLVRWLGICDGNMEEGSLRCDANISLRPTGEKKLGVKTELKNMNSIKGVEKALEVEIQRQTEILQKGGEVIQQTLLWDEDRQTVLPMRGKEEAHDYRYFPDPDLIPIELTEDQVEGIRNALPELPEACRKRWIRTFSLPAYDAGVLSEDRAIAEYFEKLVALVDDPKQAANWVMGEVLRRLKERDLDISELSVQPAQLSELIKIIQDEQISHTAGKRVFEEWMQSSESLDQIVERLGLKQVSDQSALEKLVHTVLQENPKEVQKYLDGHDKIFGFLMGKIMQASRGKANPKRANDLLRQKLTELQDE